MIYETENTNNEIFEIVTCPDSICFDKNINNKEEFEWRKNLKTGDELDFFDEDKNTWIKAQIDGIKADIVPGVLRISFRKQPGIIIGYFYYESKRIAKSCTYTKKFTQEELKLEIEEEEKYISKSHKNKDILNRLKTFKIPKQYLGMYSEKIKDILPLYLNEWNFADAITEDEIKELNNEYVNSVVKKGIINLVKITDEENGYKGKFYNGVVFNDCDTLENNFTKLGHGYDGFYDIYLKVEEDLNIKDIIKDVKLSVGSIDIKGVFDEEKNIIKFLDFKKDNPLLSIGTKYYISCNFVNLDTKNKITCHYTAFYLSGSVRLLLAQNIFIPIRYLKEDEKFIIFQTLAITVEVPENEIEII